MESLSKRFPGLSREISLLPVCTNQGSELLKIFDLVTRRLQAVPNAGTKINPSESALMVATAAALGDTFAAYVNELSRIDALEACTRYSDVVDTLDRISESLDDYFREFNHTLPRVKSPDWGGQPGLPEPNVLSRISTARGYDREALTLTLSRMAKDIKNTRQYLPLHPGDLEKFMTLLQEELWRYRSASIDSANFARWLRGIYDLTQYFPLFAFPKINFTKKKPKESNVFADSRHGELQSEDSVCVRTLRVSRSMGPQIIDLIRQWSHLHNAHIASFLGVYSSDDTPLSFVYPWLDTIPASTYVENNPKISPVKLILDAAKGLEYLHSQGVSHGDFRTENVVVDQSNNAIVTGYGFARLFQHLGISIKTDTRYLAPEILSPGLVGRTTPRLTPESDVHSFGMFICELVSGSPPYSNKPSSSQITKLITKLQRPKRTKYALETGTLAYELWNIAEMCWEFPPEKRASMSDIAEKLEGVGRNTVSVLGGGRQVGIGGGVREKSVEPRPVKTYARIPKANTVSTVSIGPEKKRVEQSRWIEIEDPERAQAMELDVQPISLSPSRRVASSPPRNESPVSPPSIIASESGPADDNGNDAHRHSQPIDTEMEINERRRHSPPIPIVNGTSPSRRTDEANGSKSPATQQRQREGSIIQISSSSSSESGSNRQRSRQSPIIVRDSSTSPELLDHEYTPSKFKPPRTPLSRRGRDSPIVIRDSSASMSRDGSPAYSPTRSRVLGTTSKSSSPEKTPRRKQPSPIVVRDSSSSPVPGPMRHQTPQRPRPAPYSITVKTPPRTRPPSVDEDGEQSMDLGSDDESSS